MRKILLLFFSGYLCLFCAKTLADIEESNQDLVGVQTKIKQLLHKMGQLGRKKSSLQEQLADVEKQVGQTVRALKKLNQQMQTTQDQLLKIRKNMRFQQSNIDKQRTSLEEQMRAAYVMGRNEKLKLLLNQQDPSHASRMMVYYDYFNTARLTRLNEISDSLQTLNALEQKNVLKSEQIQHLQKSKKIKRDALLKTKQLRLRILSKLKTKYASKEKQLLRLKKNEKKLQQLIASLPNKVDKSSFSVGVEKPFAQLRGRLPWPMQGRLLKKFGSKRAASRWDGVLISAKEGTEIHAVTKGKVVYADWLRGYGLLVIIDHGKGYMTLYAFNQSVFKAVNEWVEAGDVIAAVGNSGGRKQAGLYFGVRKNGKPVDPVKWCRKLRKGMTG